METRRRAFGNTGPKRALPRVSKQTLTGDERAYVDAYHAETVAKVGPLLDGEAKVWLEAQCVPL